MYAQLSAHVDPGIHDLQWPELWPMILMWDGVAYVWLIDEGLCIGS
jgi:hypothetical protein